MGEQVRILCVDDETHILKAMKRIFMDTDYEIITASSGEEGLGILSQTDTVQVVISDYRMPGMNGVDFLREVCSKWPHTVRIVLSGFADTVSVISAINEGEIFKFIPKPWDDKELKAIVALAVNRYSALNEKGEFTRELRQKNTELTRMNRDLGQQVQEKNQDLMFQSSILKQSQRILNALPMAVIGLDMEGMVALYNDSGAAVFGGNILGMNRLSALSPEINTFIDKVLEKGFSSDTIVSGQVKMNAKGMIISLDAEQEGIILVFDHMGTLPGRKLESMALK